MKISERYHKLSKLKKVLIVLLLSGLLFVGIIIALISPIAKYLIEKYDKQITGRSISIKSAYLNPFTGYLYLKNLRIFEANDKELFFKSDGLAVDISLWKLLRKEYVITDLPPRIAPRKKIRFILPYLTLK